MPMAIVKQESIVGCVMRRDVVSQWEIRAETEKWLRDQLGECIVLKSLTETEQPRCSLTATRY